MKIMIQGTGSSVGKSLLVAGFCRILKNEGVSVAPYKSQNMALNAWVTPEGKEIGRAQAVQAEASGIEPHVDMNPILLKPNRSLGAQVIVEGVARGHFPALEYEWMKPGLKTVAQRAFTRLEEAYDAVLIEGAGSPVEINLRKNDLVNMGFAELVDSPVILVADIDRGGVFAQLVGTMTLLSEAERKRVKGYIINKFRGDVSLLMPGIEMVKPYLGIPCLGIVPHLENLLIDDEDSVTDRISPHRVQQEKTAIGVLRYPHASNLSDFTPLEMESRITLHYVTSPQEIENMDALILPGSKHTLHDLQWMKSTGCFESVLEAKEKDKFLLGICGGFQIFGETLSDPEGVESGSTKENGLGILRTETILKEQKTTCQTEAEWKGRTLKGYEIHQGATHAKHADEIVMQSPSQKILGVESDRVFGTYLHGILDNASFRQWFLEQVGVDSDTWDYHEKKEEAYNRWANHLLTHVNWPQIRQILADSEDRK